MMHEEESHLVIDDLGVFEDHRVAEIDVLVLDEELVVHVAADFAVRLHDLLHSDIDEVIVGVDLLFHQSARLAVKRGEETPTRMNSGMRCHLVLLRWNSRRIHVI